MSIIFGFAMGEIVVDVRLLLKLFVVRVSKYCVFFLLSSLPHNSRRGVFFWQPKSVCRGRGIWGVII